MPSASTAAVPMSALANWKPRTMFWGTSFGTGVRAWRPTFVVADGATSLPACTPPLSGTAVHALASTTADPAIANRTRHRSPKFRMSLTAAPHGGDAARTRTGDNDAIGADRSRRLGRRVVDVGGLDPDRRLHDDRARAARQRQHELRTLAAFAPGLQAAAVQSGIFRRDRQAKTGTAGGASSGRVSPPEAVEHQRRFAGT